MNENLNIKKRKYAKFLIEGCLKLKSKDKLFIIGNTFIKDFIDIVAEEAQKLEITDIEYLISDPEKEKAIFLSKSYEEIIKDPLMAKTKYNKMAKEGYAFLSLQTTLPNFFDEVDKELLNKVSAYQMQSIKEYRYFQGKGLIKWNISCVPCELWAKDLELSLEELWEIIFKICLINEPDPSKAWEEKLRKLSARCEYLNNLKIDYLIYENSLGTNIKIGLPKGYIFETAKGLNIVNMPTEEVFTSPDYLRVEGRVYSSKMLIYKNNIIDKFWLEFKDGKVVAYDALKGKEILKGIMEVDEGAKFLGEVALVDIDSPIANSGLIFKHTLYDENSTCHLALGDSFPECITDGLNKDKNELKEAGLNASAQHVDFFVGTNDLKITAVLQNKAKRVIMESGNFKEE